MAAGNFTVTTGAPLIAEVWSKETLDSRENATVMRPIVDSYDTDAKFGDTVHIPSISSLVAVDKSAGTDLSSQNVTETDATITLNKHKAVPMTIENILETQSNYKVRSKYTQKAGVALAEQIDKDVLALYSAVTQTSGNAGTAVLAKADILKGRFYLNKANAPKDGRHLVIEASGDQYLFNIDDFVRYDANGKGGNDSPISTGNIGKIYGINVEETQNVGIASTVVNALMFQKSAIGLAVQKDVTYNSLYMPLKIATDVVADTIYGTKLLRADHAVKMPYLLAS